MKLILRRSLYWIYILLKSRLLAIVSKMLQPPEINKKKMNTLTIALSDVNRLDEGSSTNLNISLAWLKVIITCGSEDFSSITGVFATDSCKYELSLKLACNNFPNKNRQIIHKQGIYSIFLIRIRSFRYWTLFFKHKLLL